MKQRVITGIILVAALIPIVYFPIAFQITMALFVLIGTHELINMFSKEKPFPMVPRVICYILSLVSYLTLISLWGQNEEQNYDFNIYPIYIAVLLLVMICLLSLFVFYQDFSGADVGKCLLVINYVVLGAAALSFLRILGIRFIIYVVLLTFVTDAFAYIFGIAFGKHKMCPSISPKKSWEGAIAGTVFGTVIASLYGFFYGSIFVGELVNSDASKTLLDNFCSLGDSQDVWQFLVILLISFLGSILGQIGDLVASKLKRNYEIKDFGTIFPGHGGVLDRFDSTIFVSMFLVATFIILREIFPLF